MSPVTRRTGRWSSAGAALLAALALLAGCGSGTKQPAAASPPRGAGTGLRGLVPDPLPVKPVFTLLDTSGRPYRFTTATRGELTYLFFGYTHCPDACPATMSYLAYALRAVAPAVRRRVAVVFVTVDPRRDTGPVLRRWLDHYNPRFVGLTGTVTQIGQVEHQAGVPTAVPVTGSSRTRYAVEHSSFLLVYSPDGRAHVVYAQGFAATDYLHDMPLLLRFGRS